MDSSVVHFSKLLYSFEMETDLEMCKEMSYVAYCIEVQYSGLKVYGLSHVPLHI
jgi:hypothetical protein